MGSRGRPGITDRGREVLAARPHRGVLVVVVTCSPATVVVVLAGHAEDRPIGRPDIQGFLGALQGRRRTAVCSSPPAGSAGRRTAETAKMAARVILIDGFRLAALMVEHNIGVQDRET